MYLILSFSGVVISFMAVAVIKQLFSQQLLDVPNERSSHTQPTPRGGGLGFIISFAITSSIAFVFIHSINPSLSFWIALIPLIVIGILDDLQGMPALIRYLVQFSCACIAIAYFGAFPQPWLTELGLVGQIMAIILTLIGMTAMINLYNFMDGLDGIVAGCSAVEISFLAIYLEQPILWLLVAALMGFLWWNWSPAKIFMGDVGSTFLGAIIAIALLNNHGNVGAAWSALAIVLPLMGDAIYTLVRRLLRRENLFQAHRSHLYQRLQQSGWTHAQVASTYILLNLLIAGNIIYFGNLGAWLSLGGIIMAILSGEIYLQWGQMQEQSKV
jgi:UDP-N-acetylmuramyl pentapeptide phosphotransferase/UDP-N-acetylglucosamine-1-phosphate transferase